MFLCIGFWPCLCFLVCGFIIALWCLFLSFWAVACLRVGCLALGCCKGLGFVRRVLLDLFWWGWLGCVISLLCFVVGFLVEFGLLLVIRSWVGCVGAFKNCL